ncbi:MAG: hypothetical protein PSV17_03120 [Methylotenera sp.]|uniref:hypothetical protein n=1 Tax=Methylotenera sp. TaxID=2051956 RepID=UPI0024888E22|nr:hypothetical protein [Methylotenera sp.]MDI1308411.1 hypothetical protein [Methylotenera sp.]
MKLTVDCVLSHELANLPSASALARLLGKARVAQIDVPLEALICKQFGLNEEGDLPIATISAAADGLVVGEYYWLRADPVHFVMQRDCFSLSEPAPLLVDSAHAALMVASLNTHFAQDGLLFCIGKSGAWYLRVDKVAQITTTLPSVAMDKNVHHFMPQGVDSAKWKSILNEMQMLLHDHPANEERESTSELVVNSVWLSGGGVMPAFNDLPYDVDLITASDVLNQGLATWANIASQLVPMNFDEILQCTAQHVRLALPQNKHSKTSHSDNNHFDEVWFAPLYAALKNKQIEQLTLNIGFYEKCLVVIIKPLDTYKFWRKAKPIMQYLE